MHNKTRCQEFMTPNLSHMFLSIQQDTQILQIKNYLIITQPTNALIVCHLFLNSFK